MNRIFLVIALLLGASAYSQKDEARPHLSQDPLVGCWRFIEDGASPSVISENDSIRFIWIACCGNETLVAKSYDTEKKRFAQTSSFVSHTDGKKMYGKIFKSYAKNLEGQEISILFQYKGNKDQLWILFGDKTYKYQRINGSTLEPVK